MAPAANWNLATMKERKGPQTPEPLNGKKPNIIIVMPDQLRYDALGFTGNPVIKTPHLDAFAKESVTFTNCFAQNPVCGPSRCSIFLSQYPHVSGHRAQDTMIQDHEADLFKQLKDDGYHMAHLSPRGHMYGEGVVEKRVDEYGFLVQPGNPDLWRSQKKMHEVDLAWARMFYGGERSQEDGQDFDEAIIQGAELWLNSSPSEPFCLFLPLLWPHCPFEAEEPYFSMYDRTELAKLYEPAWADQKTGYEPKFMKAIRDAHGLEKVPKELWNDTMATYFGMITRIDDQFGRLMKIVKEKGLWERTVMSFFTDHGEYLGDSGLIEKWPTGMNDCLLKEPLIIGGAGLPKGLVIDDMTEMVDFLPTMTEIAGIGQKFPYNGKSLMPLIKQEKGYHHRDFAFSEGGFKKDEMWQIREGRFPYDIKGQLQEDHPEMVGKVISCRSQDWTYVWRCYEPAELYNRKTDVAERHNLAGLPEYAAIQASMRESLCEWMLGNADLLPWTKDVVFMDSPINLPSAAEMFRRRTGKDPLDHPFRQ